MGNANLLSVITLYMKALPYAMAIIWSARSQILLLHHILGRLTSMASCLYSFSSVSVTSSDRTQEREIFVLAYSTLSLQISQHEGPLQTPLWHFFYCHVITGRASIVIWNCSYQSARVCLQFTEQVKISIL